MYIRSSETQVSRPAAAVYEKKLGKFAAIGQSRIHNIAAGESCGALGNIAFLLCRLILAKLRRQAASFCQSYNRPPAEVFRVDVVLCVYFAHDSPLCFPEYSTARRRTVTQCGGNLDATSGSERSLRERNRGWL